ncbi:MAG: NAD(P)/FAD-dependent oxidoreductase [Burkholderiaceae bacterium]
MTDQVFDAIILGAGGAGLMCAGAAGQRGRKILVIDHAPEPGRKILISGGGRCNFTNTGATADAYLSQNPHFAKSALKRYTPGDFIKLVDKHQIKWHEKTLGQLFCDGSAKQIVKMLLDECPPEQVSFLFGHPASELAYSDQQYSIWVEGQCYRAPSLVIATGGPSIPKLGASGFAYDVAEQFGVPVISPRPALVPLTLEKETNLFDGLAGVAAPVCASVEKTAFREAALFTHRGLSGPAILQISSYWSAGIPVIIDFFPDAEPDWLVKAKREQPRQTLHGLLNAELPKRLVNVLLDQLKLGKMTHQELANVPDKPLRNATSQLARWAFAPNGTEGYAKAEVTAGGIDTAALSSKSMAANEQPGLYFIGEAVDVTGWLGGYNFQWAWASGWVAGQSL